MPGSRRRARGAAIIAAMLVTATVATLATGMLSQINGWFARSEAGRNAAQSQSLADIAVRWAAQYLAEESRLGPHDHLGELWATGLPPTPIEGGTLGGVIRDAQARFNLNNIVRTNGEISESDLALAQALFSSAEVPTAQLSALVAARRGRLLSGSDIPVAVRGLVTALPDRTTINVNTASETLLLALAPETKPAAWTDRAVKPFVSAADFWQRVAREGGRNAAPQIEIGTATRYFEVDTAATFGNARSGAQALVERQKGVVWQIAL